MKMLMKFQEQGLDEITSYEYVEGSYGVLNTLESWSVLSDESNYLLANLGDHILHTPYLSPIPEFVWGTSRGIVTISFCGV